MRAECKGVLSLSVFRPSGQRWTGTWTTARARVSSHLLQHLKGFLIAPKINVQRAVPRRLEVDVCYKCDPELKIFPQEEHERSSIVDSQGMERYLR